MTLTKKLLASVGVIAWLSISMSAEAIAEDPFLTPKHLTFKDAQRLVEVASNTASHLGGRVCIAVTDAGGALIAFQRMEGAAPGCADSAIAKAHSSAIFRITTETFMDMVNKGQPAVSSLPGMVPLGGGVPIIKEHRMYGAVGVAGASITDEIKISTQAASQL